MTNEKEKVDVGGRISEAMLDEMLGDSDLGELFRSGELLTELGTRLVERMLDAEMDAHLARPEERDRGNTRNGKTVLTDTEAMPLAAPRDRHGTFEPRLIEKYSRRLPGFDDKVMAMFAKGMGTRGIRDVVAELYGLSVKDDRTSSRKSGSARRTLHGEDLAG